jgi:hypothetical protein
VPGASKEITGGIIEEMMESGESIKYTRVPTMMP